MRKVKQEEVGASAKNPLTLLTQNVSLNDNLSKETEHGNLSSRSTSWADCLVRPADWFDMAERSFNGYWSENTRCISPCSVPTEQTVRNVTPDAATHETDSVESTLSCPSLSPFSRKRKVSFLRDACRVFADNLEVVGIALHLDFDGLYGSDDAPVNELCTKKQKMAFSEYVYPINIALMNHASLEVIEFLAMQGPEVLERPDGPEKSGSLGIALSCCFFRGKESCIEYGSSVVNILLNANPRCACITDKRLNTPLHKVVRMNVPIDTMARIYLAHQENIDRRNLLGQIPLNVAEMNTSVPDSVLDFFQSLSYGRYGG